jgi:hypothetical protein
VNGNHLLQMGLSGVISSVIHSGGVLAPWAVETRLPGR